ncbi:molecular chaperone [Entomohabitans teleogrylli]|uniref:fimbrial biogenesis chaperone n=1 Tax=Entomohabitans teleogrylli TaxID=1384589 RepID=UPI00073D6F12|nr:fimbria/pilus periplasmic chaperone [Entomohabitans teleogrylli]
MPGVMFKRYLTISAVALSIGWASCAQASVVINTTRVIYNEKAGETIVQLSNKGKGPVLIQSWIDDGDTKSRPDSVNVPFNLTPPVARLDPDKGQTLRIVRTGGGLSPQQESLFWLNVLEVPPKPTGQIAAGDNLMQFSFRSRIKLFHRPAGLTVTPQQAYDKLALTLRRSGAGYAVIVNNPSPYHITFRQLDVRQAKESSVLGYLGKTPDRMVAPFSELTLALQGVKAPLPAGAKAFYSLVNDMGGDSKYERTLATEGGS